MPTGSPCSGCTYTKSTKTAFITIDTAYPTASCPISPITLTLEDTSGPWTSSNLAPTGGMNPGDSIRPVVGTNGAGKSPPANPVSATLNFTLKDTSVVHQTITLL